MHNLLKRLESFGSPRVALLGDFILDRYIHGDVERINPEAPVPVLRTVREETHVGGTGNVALAVAALGAEACCIGVTGKDTAGDELCGLLMAAGAKTASLMRLPSKPTSVKTRYVGLAQHRNPQQMLRVDHETAEALPADVQVSIRSAARGEFAKADIVVLEDYNKGVFNDELTPQIIADANQAGKVVVVDPACIADYRRYRGASVLKPNRYEASLASGIEIIDESTLASAAAKLLEIVGAETIVITMDRDGTYVQHSNGSAHRVPHPRPRSVYDVTGAGDETLAVLAVALAEGCDHEQAAELANVAGGLEVERSGFEPVTRQEMLDELRRMIGPRSGKIIDRKRLAKEVASRRAHGETIVFTNGCFDLLHMGHVRYLQQTRELGSCMIVGVNSDASVRRLKGPTRPIIGQDERAEMLASLECVDYVTIFEEDTPIPLLKLLQPDIMTKGGTSELVGREVVEGRGGQAIKLEVVEGMSTSRIISRILETHNNH